jgi:hypothetical protein
MPSGWEFETTPLRLLEAAKAYNIEPYCYSSSMRCRSRYRYLFSRRKRLVPPTNRRRTIRSRSHMMDHCCPAKFSFPPATRSESSS